MVTGGRARFARDDRVGEIVQAVGITTRVSASFQRPNTTTQYSAADVVTSSSTAGSPMVFDGAGAYNGGTGIILDALCIDGAAQATKANLRLYLFDTAPTSAADNAAFSPTDAEMNTSIGWAEFTSWEVGTSTAGSAGNCMARADGLNMPFTCGSASDDLWGILVERGTYTPVANEPIAVRLGLVQD